MLHTYAQTAKASAVYVQMERCESNACETELHTVYDAYLQ
jgi:hypothetical protein